MIDRDEKMRRTRRRDSVRSAAFRWSRCAVALALLAAELHVAGLATASMNHNSASQDRCGRDGCEVVLSRVATISDKEVPGAFGTELMPANMDAQGRLLMAVRAGVAVFEPDGSLVKRLGGPGQGPGEFVVPTPPLIGTDGLVHVFDSTLRRLTVFDSVFPVVRTITVEPRTAQLLRSDGTYVLAEQIRTRDRIGYPLHLLSAEGDLIRSFGADIPEYRADIPLLTHRIIGLSGDRTVWAAPPGRYVFERWNPDTGERLDRVDGVHPDWFHEAVRYEPTWAQAPVGSIRGLWEDGDGLLWVLVHDGAPDWAAPLDRGEFSPSAEDINRRYDTVVQVIDPVSQEVIAARRFDEVFVVHPQSKLLTSYDTSDPLIVGFDVWTPQLQLKEEPR